MTIDDLFTPDVRSNSETLAGIYPDYHSGKYYSRLKYSDWVVNGVQNEFDTSFTIELNHQIEIYQSSVRFPDGRLIGNDAFDALPDEKFFIWLSERICSILDASLIPHSKVCFDIQNFRTYNSLKVYTFVAFSPSPAKFFKTIYQLYSLGKYCSECLHLYVKMRCEHYTPKYNTLGDMTVDISVDYLDPLNQLCEFIHLIDTFNPDTTKPEFEKFDYYQNYFKFKLFGRKIPFYLKEPVYINHRSECAANDIHTMLVIIWAALNSFNRTFVLSDKDFNRYFINESMMFLRLFQKKLFKRKNILNDFWEECAKELRKKCEDDIFNYIEERI